MRMWKGARIDERMIRMKRDTEREETGEIAAVAWGPKVSHL